MYRKLYLLYASPAWSAHAPRGKVSRSSTTCDGHPRLADVERALGAGRRPRLWLTAAQRRFRLPRFRHAIRAVSVAIPAAGVDPPAEARGSSVGCTESVPPSRAW